MAIQPPVPVPPPVPQSSVPPAAPQPAAESPGFVSTLAGLYTAPVETFRSVAARPSFVAPLVALIALNVVFTFVWMRKADPVELSKAQMEESGVFERVPVERHAAIVE